MADGNQAWIGNWRARIRGRVRSFGCETIHEFLNCYPSEPYHKVAKRLGEDVASIQLSQMQFENIKDDNELRQAAMDGFAREVNSHLKRGWGVGRHVEFHTAGVYAGWIALLEYRALAPHFTQAADAVWIELKALQPPQGWMPSGPDDPFIQEAFERGWKTRCH